jgi:hypothetical protein
MSSRYLNSQQQNMIQNKKDTSQSELEHINKTQKVIIECLFKRNKEINDFSENLGLCLMFVSVVLIFKLYKEL